MTGFTYASGPVRHCIQKRHAHYVNAWWLWCPKCAHLTLAFERQIQGTQPIACSCGYEATARVSLPASARRETVKHPRFRGRAVRKLKRKRRAA